MPRLIVSDLDGTLLDPLATLTERTVEALAAARAAGATVVFATGRSHFSAVPIIESHDVVDWVVCSNGATVWRREEWTLHRRLTVADDDAALVFDAIRSAFPDAAFAWETAEGFLWDPEWWTLDRTAQAYPARDVRVERTGPLPGDLTKVLVGVPDVPSAELVEPVAELVPDGVQVASSGAPFVEITHADAHKGAALARLAAELGLDAADAVAFGDNLNDVSMLQWAGHAVAMPHAAGNVRALADEVTVSNADDGVARVIERMLTDAIR